MDKRNDFEDVLPETGEFIKHSPETELSKEIPPIRTQNGLYIPYHLVCSMLKEYSDKKNNLLQEENKRLVKLLEEQFLSKIEPWNRETAYAKADWNDFKQANNIK